MDTMPFYELPGNGKGRMAYCLEIRLDLHPWNRLFVADNDQQIAVN